MIGDDESGAPQARLDLLTPHEGAIFAADSPIAFEALGVFTLGEVDREVEFYSDGILIGRSTPPALGRPSIPCLPNVHTFTWTNPPPGRHTLTARSEISLDTWVEAPPVRITVIDQSLHIFVQDDGTVTLVIPLGSLVPGGYDLEASSDLRTWTRLGPFQPGNVAAFYFETPPPNARGRRFYRAVYHPAFFSGAGVGSDGLEIRFARRQVYSRRTCGTTDAVPLAASRIHEHWCAEHDELEEVFGVPVGEAEAAVRFGAAHIFRLRRAVDAVARLVEAEPHRAHRIVRAGLKDEFASKFLGLGGLRKYRRVEGVVRIRRERGDVQLFAERAFIHARRDAAREMSQHIAVRAKDLELPFVEKDADERRLLDRVPGTLNGRPGCSCRR